MSFVPVTGPATFRAGDPPRSGVVEFTGPHRQVALPVRAALPVLTRAHARDDLHPSVALLSGAVLLGMRLVAAGRLEPAPADAGSGAGPGAGPGARSGPAWRLAGLDEADEDRVRMLARARAHEAVGVEEAEALVRRVLDAVADAMPRSAPSPRRPTAPGTRPTTGSGPGSGATTSRPAFTERLRERLERQHAAARRPQLVGLSLRVEADEEELVAGAVRLVLQAHDVEDPLHVCDAALLWTEDGEVHGFGDRARTHASIALRAAAEAWPVLDRLLDRLLDRGVPDEITLDTDELVSLLDEGVAALAARGVDVLWPRSLGRDLTTRAELDRAPTPREGELVKGLLGAEELFAFRWQVALDGEPLTEEEMTQLAASASPVMRLRGGWTVVDPAVARRARRRLIRTVPPAQAIAAALTGVLEVGPAGGAEAPEETPVVVGASLLGVRERLLTAAGRATVPAPAGLSATLRGYQLQGLTWLTELTDLGLGACLADDMGLGKTVTLIALHLHRAARPGAGPTLVVCPASLLGNWESEIARFAPGVPVRRFHGGRRSVADLVAGPGDGPGDEPADGPGAGFVLTTYGTLRNDHEVLAEVGWGLVVADEAQHVKNARSATARALRAVPGRARVALTGTPVENDLTELWSILDWLVPGLLGSRQAFRRVWAAPIESGEEPTKARQFADLIGPFLLRRRKSDPGIAPELPAKTETDHLLALTREQVVLYEAFVRDTMARIERSDAQARRGLVLALLTGLKQICNHPAHFLKQQAVRLPGRSEKLDLLDELLGTILAEDGAVLVFTQYVAMGRLLEAHLTRAGIPHQFLHGGTPVREREAMVARFQAAEGEQRVPVFLLSLKAGGTGLNLTRADHVVHVDRWWNPAVEEQATDRAYRIGQTRPVQVHRLITRGTIEERIAELLQRKRVLADAVLARGEAALTELGDEELRDLVTLRREGREAREADARGPAGAP